SWDLVVVIVPDEHAERLALGARQHAHVRRAAYAAIDDLRQRNGGAALRVHALRAELCKHAKHVEHGERQPAGRYLPKAREQWLIGERERPGDGSLEQGAVARGELD